MIVYRINNCTYINDLSGKGAALYGGRWNSKDTYIVYTAQSRALALLEAVVHIGKVPETGYCMAAIQIPDDSIEAFPLENLPGDWNTNPSPDYLKIIGDRFIKQNKYLALKIPSALMMEEHNYLLNPAHLAFSKVTIITERPIRVPLKMPVSDLFCPFRSIDTAFIRFYVNKLFINPFIFSISQNEGHDIPVFDFKV